MAAKSNACTVSYHWEGGVVITIKEKWRLKCERHMLLAVSRDYIARLAP
jgi:hypothetical protein